MKLVLGAVAAFLVAGGALVFAVRGGYIGGRTDATETTVESTESIVLSNPDIINDDLYLDLSAIAPDAALLDMKGMNREQLKAAIQGSYSWSLTVKNANPSIDSFKMPDLSVYDIPEEATAAAADTTADADTENANDGSVQKVDVDNPYASVTIRPSAEGFDVPDPFADAIDALVEQIFTEYEEKLTAPSSAEEDSEASTEAESTGETESSAAAAAADYVLTIPDLSTTIRDYMQQLATVWKMNPKNGDITKYDADAGKFVFGGSVSGYTVNADATAQKVLDAISQHSYDAVIDTVGESVSGSDSSIKDQYGIIGSFTTKTTSSAVRNNNIKLAAAAINGTVLQPGEEFSFNKTVGQRTEEKGYGGAPAYNEGEVVTETGGGICQVSSTLYNAVFRSGLTTTYRRSHTFAPTYVTPGMDATVSWPGPDYQFINDSDHAIGILAWYEDQTVTVQIYGVRILPKGVSWELTSEKVADLPVPAAKIITPDQGSESSGSAGSEWQAYKIIHKADGTTEKVKDHFTHYSGHTPKKYAEGTTTAAETSAAETSSAETSAAETSAAESGASQTTEAAAPSAPKETTASAGPAAETTKASVETSAEVIEAPVAAVSPGGSEDVILEGP